MLCRWICKNIFIQRYRWMIEYHFRQIVHEYGEIIWSPHVKIRRLTAMKRWSKHNYDDSANFSLPTSLTTIKFRPVPSYNGLKAWIQRRIIHFCQINTEKTYLLIADRLNILYCSPHNWQHLLLILSALLKTEDYMQSQSTLWKRTHHVKQKINGTTVDRQQLTFGSCVTHVDGWWCL
jgi:hypothetical protein